MSKFGNALDATKSVQESVARALEVIEDKGRHVDLSELEVLLSDVGTSAAAIASVVEPLALTETSEKLAEDNVTQSESAPVEDEPRQKGKK